MRKLKRAGVLLSVLCAACSSLLCAACSGENPAPALTASKPAPARNKPVPEAKRGPTAEEQTAGMVLAVTYGSSDVPVRLKFALPQRPKIGQPLEVEIALLPQVPAESAEIEASVSDGLQLRSKDARELVADLHADGVYRHSIELTPTAPGVLFLSLDVTLKHDAATETRSFMIPVILEEMVAAK
jgi:hypothetical protein